jgi:lipid intermediate transporter
MARDFPNGGPYQYPSNFVFFSSSIWIALIVSSFGKVLIILTAIGNYDEIDYPFLLNAFVFTTNAEALKVTLDLSYGKSFLMILYGILLKTLLQILIYQIYPSIPFWII